MTCSISFKPASGVCFAAHAPVLSYAILLFSLQEKGNRAPDPRAARDEGVLTGSLEAGLSKEKYWAKGTELRMLSRRAAVKLLTPAE